MPYIKPKNRGKLDAAIDSLILRIDNKGELNYTVSRLMSGYVVQRGKNYQNLSDAMAALADAIKEFYRRVVVPYENKKIEMNGDVFNLERGNE